MLSQNKNKTISLRIAEEDYKLLKVVAYMTGQSVSKYVRMYIDSSINALKMQIKQGKITNEDVETIFNDKL